MSQESDEPVSRPRLSAREREIAAGVLAGMSNRQIADRLGICEKTVRNRLTVLFEKLHVRGRLQLGLLLQSRSRTP